LKRGTPEEALGPGEALRVKKPSGKGFLLLRETETPDLAALHKEIMRDIPLSGPSQKTDLAAWHQEDEDSILPVTFGLRPLLSNLCPPAPQARP
jgi:hypothetical protein